VRKRASESSNPPKNPAIDLFLSRKETNGPREKVTGLPTYGRIVTAAGAAITEHNVATGRDAATGMALTMMSRSH